MNRFDRILGIVLQLHTREVVPAAELAALFDVSRRTIYRDIETLSLLGVPVYSELGRYGGIRLLEGYFLPPLMFSTREAVSLLLGLTFLHKLTHKPFAAELGTAEKKLLAAMPERLQKLLQDARQIINFEEMTADIFHPEPEEGPGNGRSENQALNSYLAAILDGRQARVRYKSPYSDQETTVEIMPLGMFWDRNRWYLAGKRVGGAEAVRLWRADRVKEIKLGRVLADERPSFDIQTLLGHNWLGEAMAVWRQEAPVKIQMTAAQAERLQQDWYYRLADFETGDNGRVIVTFGEDNPDVALALLRWLGPGAVLLEPHAWRQQIIKELQTQLAAYNRNKYG